MIDRIVSLFLLLVALFIIVVVSGMGLFMLYLGTLNHEWMVETGMVLHSYVLAAMCIVGEVAWLLILRRFVIESYGMFIACFLRKSDESA